MTKIIIFAQKKVPCLFFGTCVTVCVASQGGQGIPGIPKGSSPWQVPPTPVSPHGLGDNLAHQAIRWDDYATPVHPPKKWPGLIKGSIKGITVVRP